MRRTIAVAGLMLVTALTAYAQKPAGTRSPLARAAADATSRTRCWQQDIDFFATTFPAAQKDFYVLVPKVQFDRDIEELRRDVPQVSDAEIILRLMRIVARTHVGHAGVSETSGIGADVLHIYPIKLQWFSNDLVVIAAEARNKEAIGCRVVRLGSMSPLRVETLLGPYIPYENDAALRHQSAHFMAYAEMMQREHIAEPNGHLRVTCAKPDGKEFSLDLAPMLSKHPRLVGATDALHIPAMFCRKRSKENYWYEYLPDTQTLFVEYNRCHDQPGLPFTEFATKLFAFADSTPVQRLIIDVRFNPGGSASLANPLITGLKSRPALSTRGHLYVLISKRTFSAATDTAANLRRRFQAILVGETSRNTPTHYGDAGRPIELPNSKLIVHYAEKYLRFGQGLTTLSLEPEIPVPSTFEDHVAGRDRALEVALRHRLQ